jgi:hypothetical protein
MSWSDLDPFHKDSIWRRAGRELDPTTRNSAVGKLLSLLNQHFPSNADKVVGEIEGIADNAADQWEMSDRSALGQRDCELYVIDALVVAGYSSDEVKNRLLECGPEVFEEAARISCSRKLIL